MRSHCKGLRRREAALAGLGILAGCAEGGAPLARAQGPAPARPPAPAGFRAGTPPTIPVVLPPPLPCADREGDICGLMLEGPSEEGVVVIGHPFRPGDLPPGAGLGARIARGNRAIPVQLDVLARHPDGSAKHALVSVAAPRLASGERVGVVLSRAAEVGGGALAMGDALAGREAVLEIRPVGEGAAAGQPWRADLLALWRTARGQPWQSGPLALQGRVEAAVPPSAVGGVASMRLVADLSARADGTLWVDMWLRNDIAMRPNGGEAAYAVRLTLDGQEALAAEMPRHHQYRGWGRIRGSRRGAMPPAPFVRHDVAYLVATQAIPPYDLTTGAAETELAGMARQLADPAWETNLFHIRGVRTNMGDPGGRPDLGLTTQWQASWLASGDRRAAAYCIGQAEMAATIPWHFWDPGGGERGTGGWLDVKRWPRIWQDPRGGRPPLTLTQPVASDTGWTTRTSHAPALSFVPYLVTGRRGFLDNHAAQSAWTLISTWPAARALHLMELPGQQGRADPGPGDDMMLMATQIRGAAWSLRTIGDAAWIAPAGDPNAAYFAQVERVNWLWVRAQLRFWTEMQGEPHGYIPPADFGRSDHITLFQFEYFCSAAALAALRGQEDAREIVRWMSNLIVGRFFAEDRGFPRSNGVAYVIAILPQPPPQRPLPPGRPLQTWREIGDQMQARNLTNDERWRASNGEYARLAMLSLALTHRVTGDARALEAYDWVASSGAPFSRTDDFARHPAHNVTPAPRPRVPGRRIACA